MQPFGVGPSQQRWRAGTQAALRGCVNDVASMTAMITTHYGFDPANIKTLIDTDPEQESPTGANIKKNLKEIVAATVPGDILFIHFSGHGTQVWPPPPLPPCSPNLLDAPLVGFVRYTANPRQAVPAASGSIDTLLDPSRPSGGAIHGLPRCCRAGCS